MEEIMKFWTHNTCIRIVVEYPQQPFQKTRCEFSIIVYDKKIVTFCSQDSNIITPGKTQVFAVQQDFHSGINSSKYSRGIFSGSIIHNDNLQVGIPAMFVQRTQEITGYIGGVPCQRDNGYQRKSILLHNGFGF